MTFDRKKENGGPAFPTVAGNVVYSNGMTLRDWFAGQALASIPLRDWSHLGEDGDVIRAWARGAYACADAMLEARK